MNLHVDGWRPVLVEMPDSDETVMVFEPGDGEVGMGYHDGECWRAMEGCRLLNQPTHWSPLPEPPKMEGRAERAMDAARARKIKS